MLPNTLKIDSAHQDENNEIHIVSLYFQQKCYVNVAPFLMPFSMMSTLNTFIMSLLEAANLETLLLSGILSIYNYIMNS